MIARIILTWLGLFVGASMAIVFGMAAADEWGTEGPEAKVYLALFIIGIIAFIGGIFGLIM